MKDTKPYLIRAMLDWITDNHCTPYLYVETSNQDLLTIPSHLLENNPLVFNISDQSCHQLIIDDDMVSFEARFSGEIEQINIAMSCVQGIVAKENGRGMYFEPDQYDQREEDASPSTQHKEEDELKNSEDSHQQNHSKTAKKSSDKTSKLRLLE